MKTIIYIDTLFLINFIMDVYIYSLTAFILNKKVHILKIEGVSLLSALYAVFMFFPELKFIYSGLFKILFLFIPSGILFGFRDFRQLIKNTAICLLTSLGFCGCIWAIIAVTGISAKTGAVISNGILYLNLNPLILIFGILFTVAVLIFFKIFQEKERFSGKVYPFELKIGEKTFLLEALCDTGCRLYDHTSGLPVIIAERGIFDNDFYNSVVKNFEASNLSYTTISNEHETISSFIPESLSDKKYEYSAVIAISPVARLDSAGGHFNAVMNPDVLKTTFRKQKKLSAKNS